MSVKADSVRWPACRHSSSTGCLMSRITAAIQHSSSPNFTSTGRHKSLAKFALPHATKKSRNPKKSILVGWLKNVSHSSSTNFTEAFAKVALHASKKDSKNSRTSSCFLLADKCKPRLSLITLGKPLLWFGGACSYICVPQMGRKLENSANTTTVGDSTPNQCNLVTSRTEHCLQWFSPLQNHKEANYIFLLNVRGLRRRKKSARVKESRAVRAIGEKWMGEAVKTEQQGRQHTPFPQPLKFEPFKSSHFVDLWCHI